MQSFQSQDALLTEWHKRVTLSSQCHYQLAGRLSRQNKLHGVLSIALSAFVGTSLFALVSRQEEVWPRIIQGLASFAAGILATLQTFMKLSERAESHRRFGASYGDLRRVLEDARRRATDVPLADLEIAAFRERWDVLASHAPAIPEKVWETTKARYAPRLTPDAQVTMS